MRNAFLAGASAFALVLGGCSMFQSDAPNTGSKGPPAYSGSSTPPGAKPNAEPNAARS